MKLQSCFKGHGTCTEVYCAAVLGSDKFGCVIYFYLLHVQKIKFKIKILKKKYPGIGWNIIDTMLFHGHPISINKSF